MSVPSVLVLENSIESSSEAQMTMVRPRAKTISIELVLTNHGSGQGSFFILFVSE